MICAAVAMLACPAAARAGGISGRVLSHARYAPASKSLSLRDDAAGMISITLRHNQQEP